MRGEMDLVGFTECMNKGIVVEEDKGVNLGVCGEEHCGGNCAECGEALFSTT